MTASIAGHANVWAPMSADEERGLVFLPTSSPSPDFWGGKRPGNNEHANSVVALRAETGELVWSFQTVHHDVWDYDLPAQPTLARIDTGEGHARRRDPADQAGFCLRARPRHRQAGMAGRGTRRAARRRGGRSAFADAAVSDPCAVAAAAADLRPATCSSSFPGWVARPAKTQLSERAQRGPLHAALDARHAVVSVDRRRRQLGRRGVRSGQPDPLRQHQPRRSSHQADSAQRGRLVSSPPPGHDFGPQQGAPFAMSRAVAMSPLGLLCNKPPWGEMVAVDLKAGKILWHSTVGTTEDRAPLGLAFHWGTPLAQRRRDHRRRPGFHRRDGCLFARLRCQNRARNSGRAGCRSPASPIP